MCHLAAYVGDKPIAPLLLRALELQEPYFGGHATGLGVIDDGVLKVEKDFGHVARVKKTTEIESLKGTTGIAHSRYNGKARDDPRYNTKEMAHPFVDDTGTLALMHNGGIHNYKEHWQRLREGHTFKSYSAVVDDITDSEVAVHMLSDALAEGMSMEEGLRSLASQFTGFFLLGCITSDEPETVWIANWHQPCVVAVGDNEAMFCSMHIGFHHVRNEFDKIFEPPKNSLLKLTRGRVDVVPLDTNRRVPHLKFDNSELGRSILSLLRERGELEIMSLSRALTPDDWARAFGITPERWNEYRKAGVGGSYYIETLNRLIAEGKIRERVELRLEGGVAYTPRFSYSMA